MPPTAATACAACTTQIATIRQQRCGIAVRHLFATFLIIDHPSSMEVSLSSCCVRHTYTLMSDVANSNGNIKPMASTKWMQACSQSAPTLRSARRAGLATRHRSKSKPTFLRPARIRRMRRPRRCSKSGDATRARRQRPHVAVSSPCSRLYKPFDSIPAGYLGDYAAEVCPQFGAPYNHHIET